MLIKNVIGGYNEKRTLYTGICYINGNLFIGHDVSYKLITNHFSSIFYSDTNFFNVHLICTSFYTIFDNKIDLKQNSFIRLVNIKILGENAVCKNPSSFKVHVNII